MQHGRTMKYEKEKPKKELAYEYWIAEGHTSWTEEMKDHEEHSISKSQFYKIQNKQKQKDKENIIWQKQSKDNT